SRSEWREGDRRRRWRGLTRVRTSQCSAVSRPLRLSALTRCSPPRNEVRGSPSASRGGNFPPPSRSDGGRGTAEGGGELAPHLLRGRPLAVTLSSSKKTRLRGPVLFRNCGILGCILRRRHPFCGLCPLRDFRGFAPSVRSRFALASTSLHCLRQ